MMVYQHHERIDGNGYPVRAKEVHDWARLCAVADVFDALSCQRPYRRALPVPEVLRIVQRHAGIGLDGEVVQCLASLLEAANSSVLSTC